MNTFPQVGDIKLSKVSGSYNTYRMELSFGQLEAIKAALTAKHDDAISDELLTMIQYYSSELPGPGEEKEDKEGRQKGAEAAEEDFPIPMPPGRETAVGPDSGEEEEGRGGGEEELPAPEGGQARETRMPKGFDPETMQFSPDEGGEDEAEGTSETGPEEGSEPTPESDEFDIDRELPEPPAR